MLEGYDFISQYYLCPGDYVSDDEEDLVALMGGYESEEE